MNLKKYLLSGAVIGSLLTAAVAPAAVVVTELVTDSTTFSAPAPLKVVAPVNVPRHYQNETIRLSMTVDETGQAHNIHLLQASDARLEKSLYPAIAQWKFQPAMVNGKAVSADVVLPLQVVDGPAS